MVAMVKGTDLAPSVQEEAKRRFVHRFTKTHVPKWAAGTNYPVQFRDDDDWLANTLFYVRKDGQLSNVHKSCRSNPTWPDGMGAWGQKGVD